MRIIVHNEQTSIHNTFTNERNVVEHILGLFNTGRGVDIGTELGSIYVASE